MVNCVACEIFNKAKKNGVIFHRKAQEAATRKLTEAEYISDDDNSNITSSGARETTVY